MLYLITFLLLVIWMVALVSKKRLTWHALVLSYCIAVFCADMLEVTFNLLLQFYKFPTHLTKNPIYENELGIIFSDTLILPAAFIIFVYYARKGRPWTMTLLFASLFTILEWIYLKFEYLRYIHWSLAYSAAFYVAGFRVGASLAPRIASYDPPMAYRIRLLCFSHTVIMWFGALFSLPLLKLFRFRPGVFQDIMADCRFTDLLSGDLLALICVLVIPRTPDRMKLLTVTAIACIGFSFSLYAYYSGWLIYSRWNHFLMAMRYFAPLYMILLYDRWERSYGGQNIRKGPFPKT
ncbi:hypothetical protein [Paenibacillus harenae]|uniref:hypothetical protein n=1 Tax=Paenibacillus harenae TaxID=306543 RepID=UPI000425B7C0|nr:hypothetical protein [Paenibacillus harenae]